MVGKEFSRGPYRWRLGGPVLVGRCKVDRVLVTFFFYSYRRPSDLRSLFPICRKSIMRRDAGVGTGSLNFVRKLRYGSSILVILSFRGNGDCSFFSVAAKVLGGHFKRVKRKGGRVPLKYMKDV